MPGLPDVQSPFFSAPKLGKVTIGSEDVEAKHAEGCEGEYLGVYYCFSWH